MSIMTDPRLSAHGVLKWLSRDFTLDAPELIFPEQIGLSEVTFTAETDCYALGMSIFEVRQAPLSENSSVNNLLIGATPSRRFINIAMPS